MAITTTPTLKKVDKKITGYSVVAKDAIAVMKAAVAPETKIEVMSSDWKRHHALPASVYKIEKCPNSPDAAVYVTISNAVLNPGTEHETVVPAEIFINSKDVSHQQWITALTRTISAIFRKGGDMGFIVDELLGICDPGAGFLQRGVWHPSLISQVGGVIKEHLEGLKGEDFIPPGMREPHQPVWGKEGLYKERGVFNKTEEELLTPSYPPNATICPKCNHKAVTLLDGCATCLSCGESKCS
jgi:hypothetical protein